MAQLLEPVAHPVLTFYRAHHWGQSWLVSVTTLLDTVAPLLIATRDGLLAARRKSLTAWGSS